MTTGMDDLENVLLTPEELLASLVPEEQELALDNLLDYPREMVERIIFEREDYWTKLLTSEDRTAMLDYIREICFALGWQLYSDEDISLMPENLRKPISLQILMEYCQGIFQRLSRLIVLIDQSPNRQLTRERVWVDFSMTKKAGVGSINWLMSHPRSHRFEKVAPDSPIAPTLKNLFTQADENGEETSYLPTQLSETLVYIDYNTYANRFVRRFLTRMHKDMNMLSNLADRQGEDGVRSEAATLMWRITELLQYDFLKYSSPKIGRHQPATLHKNPYYHEIYELHRQYERIFNFDWGNPLFQLPLRRTWLLYEYWCFFKIIELLQAQGFRMVKDRITLFFEDPESKLTLEMPKGQPSVLELLRDSDDALVTILYSGEAPDETFLNQTEDMYHPIAPTVFMMFEGKAYLFEVKFKRFTAGGIWHDDLDRLHGYRDALGASGTKVQEAWCIYPNAETEGHLEPMPSNPAHGDREAPSGGGIGVLSCHPTGEESWESLGSLLARWFPDLTVPDSPSPAPGRIARDVPSPAQPERAEEALPPEPRPGDTETNANAGPPESSVASLVSRI